MSQEIPPTSPTPTPTAMSLLRDTSFLIQLHIAEYQTLTTRNTYWITLQYALWPLLLLILGFLAQVRNTFSPQAFVWSAAFAINIIVLAHYSALYEQYNNIRYIERELRPLLEDLVGKHPFWKYEPYVNDHRGLHPVWWECSPTLLSFGALVLAWSVRVHCWSTGDYFGLILNGAAVLFIARKALVVVKTRKEFFA